MEKVTARFGVFVLACAVLGATGCSSPSASDSAPKIDGMTPAEYREKAEQGHVITTPGPNSKGPSKRR